MEKYVLDKPMYKDTVVERDGLVVGWVASFLNQFEGREILIDEAAEALVAAVGGFLEATSQGQSPTLPNLKTLWTELENS